MLISAIIPTYMREQLLGRAVRSVLSQCLPDAELEVIVVNDSGEPLSAADWQQDHRVTVVTTGHVERCFARNTGAALSQGGYLHFLDDDDMLLPGAYVALLRAAVSSNAAWTHGGYEEADDDGKYSCLKRPCARGNLFALAVAAAAIPLQASLIRRDSFFDSGGFAPEYLAGQDVALLQEIARTGRVESTEATVARIRVGPQGATTTRWSLAQDLGRIRREKAFAMPWCLPELQRSLAEQKNNATRGSLVRFYIGSGIRHTRGLAPLTAMSRFGIALRLALPGIASRRFWRGIKGGR